MTISDNSIDYDSLIEKLINEEIPKYLDNVGVNTGPRQTKLIDSVVASLQIGIDGEKQEQKLGVVKRDELYSVAFFGFDSGKSSTFASHTSGGVVNDNKTYTTMAKNIAGAIFSKDNSCFKYFINDEAWLLDKLRIAKEKTEDIIGLPEVIICPYDVTFCDGVTKLLTGLPVIVQRISPSMHNNDPDILSVAEQVKYDNVVGEQVVSKVAGGFENSIMQIESAIRKQKLLKYNTLYNKKFADIDDELTSAISSRLAKYDGTSQLYLHTIMGNDVKLEDLDYVTNLKLENGEYLKNESGKKIDFNSIKDSLNALKEKQDELMFRVLKMYKERDIATYYHVTRMIALVDKIKSGLTGVDSLNSVQVERLKKMIILHDIGKLVIPSPIINKTGKLEGEDKEIMDSHVYLENVQIVFDQYIWSLLKSALLHHRGVNRKVGYADENLVYEKKDRLSQIVSVLDVVEALTTDKRPYRKSAVSDDVLYDELREKISEGLLDKKYVCALISKMGYDVSKLSDSKSNNVIPFKTNDEENGKGIGK